MHPRRFASSSSANWATPAVLCSSPRAARASRARIWIRISPYGSGLDLSRRWPRTALAELRAVAAGLRSSFGRAALNPSLGSATLPYPSLELVEGEERDGKEGCGRL